MLNPSHREIKKEGLPLEDVSPQNTFTLYHKTNKTYMKINGTMYLISEKELIDMARVLNECIGQLEDYFMHSALLQLKKLHGNLLTTLTRREDE